ncbi:uncharacterized protein PG998_010604 [Apiospora kogelbergensis]|uniref:uncharacterized protein n=1 Tax=Apiospora kogelbergensis TaxID=1337665 RepID=UPI00312EF124
MELNDADDVLPQLWQWMRSYNNDSGKHYLFSPEWEAFQEVRWQHYEALDSRRLNFHIPISSRQKVMENLRAEILQLKAQNYSPLNEALYELCPLAIRMDKFEGHDSQNRMYPWKSLLENWSRFQALFSSNDEFQRCLSVSQRASFLLLKDWWEASYCDPYLTRKAREWFEQRRETLDEGRPLLIEAADAKTNFSLYHASCFELFLLEFHPYAWEPYLCLIHLQSLQFRRYRAGCHALVQRISYASLFRPASGTTPGFPTVLLNKTEWARIGNPTDHPGYLWDTELRRTVMFDSITGNSDYICVSHTWGRWRRKHMPGAKIPGVDWRVPRNSRFNVKDLPYQLTRLGTRLGHRYIWIDLFCIPQDGSQEAKTEIQRQASIFRGCRASIAWLNDVESWDGVTKGLKWFSLKLQMNTIRDYDSPTPGHRPVTAMQLDAATLAAQAPAELCQHRSPLEEPISWFSSLWTLQEAVLCPDITLCSRDWTQLTDDWGVAISLQSLMVFLNECHDQCITEGPIHESFFSASKYSNALMSDPDRRQWIAGIESWPTAARQLQHLRDLTRLDNVFINRSPAVICTNANIRYCESKERAPAIMSALGVTEWYKARNLLTPTSTSNPRTSKGMFRFLKSVRQRKRTTQPLVLDMYPLEFLAEAHRLFGASFFETASYTVSLNDEAKASLRNEQSMGTMLPFTKKQGWHSGVIGSFEHTKVQVVDHASVATWSICQDGSVAMRSIGCVCSSSKDPNCRITRRPIKASVLVAGQGQFRFTGESRLCDDLAIFLNEIAGNGGIVYAVMLYEDCHRQHGILLYSLAEQEPSASRRSLMKIGVFIAHEWDSIDTRSVDWTVL